MKKSIADYLKQGVEGPFFYRMVETVLSRDKNWARWKIENCPSIARPSVTPEEYLAAKSSAHKATTNKRLRPNPLGSLDLKFLSEGESQGGLERLKDPSRYRLPTINSFQSKIELDDMDIDMARDEESKNAAIESKASKSWRALRIASASKLVAFDKIERSDKIDEIFKDDVKAEEPVNNADEETMDGDESIFPKDRRPIVISGPSGVGKGTLVKMLMDKHPKVLGKKASHTTRSLREGEVNGQHYYFVTKEQYNVMRDGDEFLELNNFNGNDYGTSRKVVEGIIAQNKVPVMEMDMHVSSNSRVSNPPIDTDCFLQGIQQLKDNGYAARFIFLAPPDVSELEQRLRRRGSDGEEKIKQSLEIAKRELQQAELEGFHDKTFVNDDLETTYRKLESYIFYTDEKDDAGEGTPMEGAKAADTDTEVEIADNEAAQVDETPKEGDGVPVETNEGAAEPADGDDTAK